MASLGAAIKSAVVKLRDVAILAAACAAMLTLPAHAATFRMDRGINMDIWVTWPGEEAWGDEAALRPFPEWRKTVGDEALRALAEAGFDGVRIPVDPAVFLSDATSPSRDALYRDVLDAARAVNAAGLKAIVDLHLFPRSDNPAIGMEGVMGSETTFAAYVEVVRRMGRTLAGEDPRMVAFELMNEPSGACDGDWQERLQRLYAAARSSATRLTLVLTGACGGSAEGLAAIDPKRIGDNNVIWSFHSYQPFLMTHQGAKWAGDFIRYVTGLTYPLHAMPALEREAALGAIRERIRAEAPWTRRSAMLSYLDEQVAALDTEAKLAAEIERPFALVADWAAEHGIPPSEIILGEFGMIRQEWENPSVVPAASRAAYVRDMIGHAEAHGFAWAMWGYGGAFGVVEEFEGRAAEPDLLDVVRTLPLRR